MALDKPAVIAVICGIMNQILKKSPPFCRGKAEPREAWYEISGKISAFVRMKN